MRAFVMAAGKGTRLAPLTDALPKPAIPVANEPVMGILLRLLARHGIRQVVSNISYKAADMRMVFGDGTAYGVDLAWSHETELLGTAGGLKRAEADLRDGSEPVVVLSGDGLHDTDISALVREHRAHGAAVTIALKRVADPSEYGVAILDEAGAVVAFQEKPALGEELSELANTGIYVLEPDVFDLLPGSGFYDFGTQLFPRMLHEGIPMAGVALDGYWNDIGGLEAYRDGNLAALDGRLSRLAAGEGIGGELGEFGDDVLVHPSARIEPGATIIGPAVIGPCATIASGARVARSVVLPFAHVPEGSLLAASTFGSFEGLIGWARSLGDPAQAAPGGAR